MGTTGNSHSLGGGGTFGSEIVDLPLGASTYYTCRRGFLLECERRKTGGVALLLDPWQQHVCQPQELWSKWVIALVVDNTLFINVYAPNDRHEREEFLRACGGDSGHNLK